MFVFHYLSSGLAVGHQESIYTITCETVSPRKFFLHAVMNKYFIARSQKSCINFEDYLGNFIASIKHE
jgi:hypothetical protein